MSKSDLSGVRLPPPVILLAVLALALFLDNRWPWPLLPQGLQYAMGSLVIALALGLFVWAFLTFRKAGTPVDHLRPSKVLVTTGPFAYSRNPIYVAMGILLFGLAITIDTPWILGAIPVALGLIDRWVIRREEAYMSRLFGADYAAYKKRTRRWI